MPCVRCNQSVKFTDLLALARDLGAERAGDRALRAPRRRRRTVRSCTARADPARDQSWFLFATTREQLAFTLFPLGDMPDKAAVRAEAARLGLPVADKPDSQDICFVPSGSYAELVGRLRPDALSRAKSSSETGACSAVMTASRATRWARRKRLGRGRYAIARQRQVVVRARPGRRRVVVGPRAGGAA